jgi:hypothetical protein
LDEAHFVGRWARRDMARHGTFFAMCRAMRIAMAALGVGMGVFVAPTVWSQAAESTGSVAPVPVAVTAQRGASDTELETQSSPPRGAADADETESYAHWVVVSDLSSVVLGVGALSGAGELGYASAAAYLLGGPTVHAAHGEGGKAALSFLLRLGVPSTSMLVVDVLSRSSHCPADDADENDIHCKPIVDRILLAGAIGIVVAMVIDPVLLARRSVPRKHAFTIEPNVAWTKTHGWSLGVQGSF